ncbi:MAG TPA: hypothetical protein PLH57_02025 [Oligoflexia bacterium]|nr:hypothetical protein [Oligoflexia bacterium]
MFNVAFRSPKKATQGLSLLELVISVGLAGVIALVASGILANLQRAANHDKIRRTQLEIARLLSNTLKDSEAVVRTAQGAFTGNRNIRRCLYQSQWENTADCLQRPYMRVIETNIVPIDVVQMSPQPVNFTTSAVYHFELRNASNQYVHPPGVARWTIDGVLCDGRDGRPVYTYASRDACPIRSELAYVAACNDNLASEASCYRATDIKFVYWVSVASSSLFGGGANFPTVDSTSMDPILQSVEKITRTEIVATGSCNLENGQVLAGVTTDRNLRCVQVQKKKTLLARHSFSSSVPNCSFQVRMRNGNTFTNTQQTFPNAQPRLDGYSFAGAFTDIRVGTNIDLGGAGSCVDVAATRWDQFTDGITIEIDDELEVRRNSSGDFTLWLANLSNPPDGVSYGEDNENVVGARKISRCAVCEIPGEVSVVHNINRSNNTVPNCPDGWGQLYAGFSFGSFTAHSDGFNAGYTANQDMASPGSCLQMEFPYHTPFIECHHTSDSSDRRCLHNTSGDYAQFFGGRPMSTSESGRWSRCSVCYKPQKITQQPNDQLDSVSTQPLTTQPLTNVLGG